MSNIFSSSPLILWLVRLCGAGWQLTASIHEQESLLLKNFGLLQHTSLITVV